MRPALIADTGGLLRALAADRSGDAAWPAYEAALREATAVIVPAPILTEIDYFLRAERQVMRRLMADIFDPASRYELEQATPEDLVRALEIDARFCEMHLGLVDGCVGAIAERRRVFRVLTTDRAHFSALRVGRRFDRALTLVP